jgi:hypothetical protein
MKDRTLYHLLLTSGRSVRDLVDPAKQALIDEIAATLRVDRAGRGRLAIAWSQDDEIVVHEIVSARFTFHARGDVPALVQKRPEQFDVRQQNWLECHRLWGELIGDPTLQSMSSTPSRSMPLESVNRWSGAPTSAAAVGIGAVALALAHFGGPSGLVAAVCGASVGTLGRRPIERSRRFALSTASGAAAAAAASIIGGAQPHHLREAAAGVAALLFASEMAPPAAADRHREATSLVAVAGLAGALALGSVGFALVAAGLLLADAIAMVLRSETRRLRSIGLRGGLAIGGALLLRSFGSWDNQFAADRTASALILAAAAALLGATSAIAASSGVVDRMSSWLAPVGVAILGLVSALNGSSASMLAVVCAGLGASVARALCRRPAVAVDHVPIAEGPPAVNLAIRTRST